MKSWKKVAIFSTICALILSLAACGKPATGTPSSSTPESGTPTSGSPAPAAPSFPDGKTVTLVVPFAAGGNVDLCARIIAEEMSKVLNTNVVVEDRVEGKELPFTLAKNPSLWRGVPRKVAFRSPAPGDHGGMK